MSEFDYDKIDDYESNQNEGKKEISLFISSYQDEENQEEVLCISIDEFMSMMIAIQENREQNEEE